MKRMLAAGVACLAMAGAVQAQETPNAAPGPMEQPRDWSATLIQDATGLHAVMVDSHPGVHDPLNPGFRARLDQGLATALERAKTTTDRGGWWWAMRAYVASFEDGHVQIGLTQRDFGFPTRWPGFLTVYRGADQVVADRDESDAAAPPLGARLIDCDGVDAATLAEQRIGQFRGRWFLEAIKTRFGDWMFLSEAKQDALRAAPYVVLDLRGNGGGSSHWSQLMAQVLWGDDWMAAHPEPAIEGVDWRASDGNIAEISAFLDKLRATNGQAELIAWAEDAITGMTAAKAAGQVYWRSADDDAPKDAAPPPPAPQLMAGRVYVLTDSSCGSACLDAVDLWKTVGAVQVGRETSADTVYMEIREPTLPSGLAEIAVPMKVYRGRARGNNEPQRPQYVIEGDMGDDAALLTAIRRLQPD
ncbi:MAG: peptidase S41 [Brevundimonas diminuta]|nr:S41 family peptidase [Brevundimonas diminuta]MBD3820316.1 peptidase S41 [Brevundimonas diminuta]